MSQLTQVVNNINSREEIKFVVVIGDITLRGGDNEFAAANKILDKLKVDYYPVLGFSDMKYGSSGGSIAKELFEDDKFTLEVGTSSIHIGMNDFTPWRTRGHFSIEDLKWLDTEVTTVNSGEELNYYSSVPLNEKNIGNWYEVPNRLRAKNWRAVFYPAQQNRIITEASPPVVEIGPSLNKENYWNYTLVDYRTDSLFFYQISQDTLQELWGALSKADTAIKPITASDIEKAPIETITDVIDSNYAPFVLWQKDLQKEMYAPILITEDKIFTASFSGEINCFDLEGNPIWTHQLDRTILSNLTREKDLLLIGTIEGDLFSINANNGNVVQVIGVGEPITSQLVTADVHYNDKDTKGVIAGTSNGNVYFYEIYSFELIWMNNSSKEMIETKPLVLRDKILFTSQDGYLYNVDLNSGVLNWKWSERNSGSLSSPVTNGKFVFVSSPDKNITAIDLLQGTQAWRKNEYKGFETLNISDDKKKLLIKSLSDYFNIADAATGKADKKIKCPFGIDPDPSPILEINNEYLFGTGYGTIYRIDKTFRCTPVLFLGNARVTTLQSIGDSVIAAADCDGKIVLFKLKQD
ncbi:MAG: PQQ-binding-like beta-propeller repeat protein [Ignavibacteriaceae bacterium]|nr:PQQ-binding-like beta-propeller repeat protein [Ignavibacteriaceae bacterium]